MPWRQIPTLAVFLIALGRRRSSHCGKLPVIPGILVGTAVRPYFFPRPAYSATLAREFNMVEPEDAMKWWALRHDAGAFDFREGDEVVRFAQAHDMKVRGHCLVWDHNNPDWLTQGHFTPASCRSLLQEHIATVMKHYAGQVFAWDVVNEALDENGKLRDSLWYNQPGIGLADKGTAYIEQAFRWAHEADPHALLFYNEAEGEGLNRKSDAIYAMVKDFKRRGVPIDGVGLQMHISRLDVDTAAIAANIARLTALGVQVHITELDVSLPVDSNGPPQTMTCSARLSLSRHRPRVPAKSGLHRDSDLGIHRQIFLDRLSLPRHPRRCAAFRPRLPAQARLRRHARGDFPPERRRSDTTASLVCAACTCCLCIYNDLHIRAARLACAWTSNCPWHNRLQSGPQRR